MISFSFLPPPPKHGPNRPGDISFACIIHNDKSKTQWQNKIAQKVLSHLAGFTLTDVRRRAILLSFRLRPHTFNFRWIYVPCSAMSVQLLCMHKTFHRMKRTSPDIGVFWLYGCCSLGMRFVRYSYGVIRHSHGGVRYSQGGIRYSYSHVSY